MARQEGEKEHFGGFSGGEITSDVFEGLYDCLTLCNLEARQRNRRAKREWWMQGQAVEMSGFKTEQMSGFKGAARVSQSIMTQKNNSPKFEKLFAQSAKQTTIINAATLL